MAVDEVFRRKVYMKMKVKKRSISVGRKYEGISMWIDLDRKSVV